jgi:hypothetical protein
MRQYYAKARSWWSPRVFVVVRYEGDGTSRLDSPAQAAIELLASGHDMRCVIIEEQVTSLAQVCSSLCVAARGLGTGTVLQVTVEVASVWHGPSHGPLAQAAGRPPPAPVTVTVAAPGRHPGHGHRHGRGRAAGLRTPALRRVTWPRPCPGATDSAPRPSHRGSRPRRSRSP